MREGPTTTRYQAGRTREDVGDAVPGKRMWEIEDTRRKKLRKQVTTTRDRKRERPMNTWFRKLQKERRKREKK